MRASLGSLSGAVTVFDPERLEAIIARSWPYWGEESEWGEELVPLGRDLRLQDAPGARQTSEPF
jgi:hypothetical protein